jgi:hypothetical protein
MILRRREAIGAAVRRRAGAPVLGERMAHNCGAADLPRRQMAMRDVAAKRTEAPERVEEADRPALRAAGFGDCDIDD